MDEQMEYSSRRASGLPGIVLLAFALIVLVSAFVSSALFWTLFTVFIIYVLLAVRVLPEYKRGVLFTLGRYDGVVGPGLVVIIPIVQSLRVVDLRVHTLDILPQEVITKDNVSVRVNGVVFYRVLDPAKAVLKVNDYVYATSAIAQTTLRDVVGGVDLDGLLENRDEVAAEIRKIVDQKTDEWGIDITEIRLQDITLPENMKRAMAVQAEAEREKRAVIIKAEGELVAAENYAKAAKTLSSTPGGLTLRTLQTINDISKDPSQKIYFILPIELLESWSKAREKGKK
ncbi:MAG: hypothetical protein PWP76_597 [Candidatus Diapherotrites archaeon]|nr:hypothetical protein [Candidatus Diapherotrites archaeon]